MEPSDEVEYTQIRWEGLQTVEVFVSQSPHSDPPREKMTGFASSSSQWI